MKTPRLRVFAGPNGSGKSTLFETFSKTYPSGLLLNADIIEKELSTRGFIDLSDYDLNLNHSDFEKFLVTDEAKSLIKKSEENNCPIHIVISQNIIVNRAKESNSYEGALICSFLKEKLQEKRQDFSYETVMSHVSKIEFIKNAKESGYKTYLYFICIDDPEINISRVQNRIHKGGHAVSEIKIEERYYKTLNNLISAIEVTDKSYLFDNSGEQLTLLAKVVNNKLEMITEPNKLPNWFIDYVLKYYM
jgi:predicted ABC-type ATPase